LELEELLTIDLELEELSADELLETDRAELSD